MNLPDCPTPTQKYDRIVMAHGGGGTPPSPPKRPALFVHL